MHRDIYRNQIDLQGLTKSDSGEANIGTNLYKVKHSYYVCKHDIIMILNRE